MTQIQRVHWGIECWEFGLTPFYLKLDNSVSDATPRRIHRIRGVLTVGCLPGCDEDGDNTRQTLVSLFYSPTVTPPQPSSAIVGAPSNTRFAQSISNNFVVLNGKQTGDTSQSITFDREWGDACPLIMPNGYLRAVFDNKSCSASGCTPGTNGPSAVECPDVELHVEVFFSIEKPTV